LNIKRSHVKLFDVVKAPIATVDATISLSLLDKLTVDDIEKWEWQKVTIPEARVLSEVRGYEEAGLKVSKPMLS